MNFTPRNGFEQIKISDKLDNVVEKAINKAKKDKKKNMLKLKLIKLGAVVASIFIIFITSVKFIPVFAKVLSNVTIGPSITRELKYHYDKNIETAIKEGLSQNVNKSKTDKGIEVTINNVVSDDKNLFIFYTLNGKENKDGLNNLLLQNFRIADQDGGIILDSTSNYYPKLPAMLYNRDGDFLLTYNENYKCIVTSLGDNLKNYSQNEETYGAIELSTCDGGKIPNELAFKFTSLTEAYKMSYSKEKYNDFVTKFYKEPTSVKGNWDFNIKVDQKMVVEKPEEYNDIKFYVNHTDFNIKSFKIYPTQIELKIQLGKNKLNSLQCYSLGHILEENGKSSNSKLPYLVDEKGNKYLLSDTDFQNIDSNNCINLNFQSCYFNNPSELYLVINELDYNNGSQNLNEDIGTVKIRIK